MANTSIRSVGWIYVGVCVDDDDDVEVDDDDDDGVMVVVVVHRYFLGRALSEYRLF